MSVIRPTAGWRRLSVNRARAGRRWLSARLAGNRRDGGVVAATAAVLFGSGVILGIAALVVDIGLIYAEHGQLQRGADAAALKIGQVCARDVNDCTSSEVDDLAAQYARGNAANGEADAQVCGSGGGLPACPANTGGLSDCVDDAPTTGDYLQVRTNTLRPNGSTLLPPAFAQAVLGGFEGAEVTACARVAWGPPAKARSLAMTISTCDWKRHTAQGATYPSAEVAIPLYDDADATACGVAGTAAANPGGFRWLEDTDAGCRAALAVDSVEVANRRRVDPLRGSPLRPPRQPTGRCGAGLRRGHRQRQRHALVHHAGLRGVRRHRLEPPRFHRSVADDDDVRRRGEHLRVRHLQAGTRAGKRHGHRTGPRRPHHRTHRLTQEVPLMTRRIIAVTVAIVLAAIGTGAVLLYLRTADARALEGKEARTVLIADKVIPAGTGAKVLVEEKYVREDRMPAETLPEGVLSDVPADLEALVTTAAVQPGQLLTHSMFGTAASTGSGLAIPEGKLAITARVRSNVFSPETLSAGAKVVIFYTYTPISDDRPR